MPSNELHLDSNTSLHLGYRSEYGTHWRVPFLSHCIYIIFRGVLGNDIPCVFIDSNCPLIGIGKTDTNVEAIFHENLSVGAFGFLLIAFK